MFATTVSSTAVTSLAHINPCFGNGPFLAQPFRSCKSGTAAANLGLSLNYRLNRLFKIEITLFLKGQDGGSNVGW